MDTVGGVPGLEDHLIQTSMNMVHRRAIVCPFPKHRIWKGTHKAFVFHPGNSSLNRNSRGLREAGGVVPMWVEVSTFITPSHSSIADPLQAPTTTRPQGQNQMKSVQMGLTP